MSPVLAPPPHAAPAAQTAALKAAAALQAEAVQALGSPSPAKAVRLRLRSALALRERHLGRAHPLSLATRGVFGLLLDREGDPRGLRLYAEACGGLHRRLLTEQRIHGLESPELLGCLETLGELYGYESLKADRWEDRALGILVPHSRGVRPDLERRVVAALQRHYGPWLSFRPPETDRVLEDAARLLELWFRRQDPAEYTREFAETGLRSDARGVWGLVARKGGEELALTIQAALKRLDPDALLGFFDAFVGWMEDQKGRPWAAQALDLGRGMDKVIDASPAGGLNSLTRRIRLAEALGDPGRAARLLTEALRAAESIGDVLSLGARAGHFLDRAPDPELNRAVEDTLLLRLPELLSEAEGRRWIEAEARRLERAGRGVTAEELWRALYGRPGPEGTPESAGWSLGRNLAAQGRWEEARAFLEPLLASKLGGSKDAELRFFLANVELRLGQTDMATLRAREGLERIPAEGPLQPVPGLAGALRRLAGDESFQEQWTAILARLRKTMDPNSALSALADPAVLIGLVEKLELAEGPPPPGPACGEPWIQVAAGPQEGADALLRAAQGLPAQQAVPCLKGAVKLLESAWGNEDPRLLAPLMQLGKTLSEQQDPKAEAVLRRALGLFAGHPDLDPGLKAEALARLGHFLSEEGRGSEAETLLRQAMGLLGAAPAADEKRLKEVGGGVYIILLSRMESLEDYEGCLALLDEAEALTARIPELRDELAKELDPHRAELRRKAKLQVLLRAQGLP
jgi:tetratricopeptide (TPR) repeat protein